MSQGREPNEVGRFGTLGGVFTPCVLTILGVIMFLRFGSVVGQAGIMQALVIVLAAKVITTLTTLSLSAIATNTRVKAGGAYFLISRSLGVEFGGAIGIVFFLAQAISVAMYVVGFSEAYCAAFPSAWDPRIVGTITNVVVFICVFIGAGWTIKLQYGILGLLVASLVSFYVGAIPEVTADNLRENLSSGYVDKESFFTIFALFFPAVTGIMAGANMSGDLKAPAKSIPQGTLWAVVFTAVIYLSMGVVLGGATSRESLIGNNLVIGELSAVPILITAGVFAATLSSALGSMMGAPRILQAFARDDVFRMLRVYAKGSGANSEPRRAIVLTFIIAQVCIVLGDLDAIAPIITMFFMITYGTLNLATFYESITRNPSYRPRFKYCHWLTALLGAAGCFAVMFLISPAWASASIIVMAFLYKTIGFLKIDSKWGDVQSGILFERTRRNILKLEEAFYHPKNWRPTVLALVGPGHNRTHLAVFGHWFTSGHGILTIAHVITGNVEELLERRKAQEKLLRKFIREQELEAFPSVVVAPYLSDAVESLVQCHGLGGLSPNTVLLGWPGDPGRVGSFGVALRIISGLGRSIISIRIADSAKEPWETPLGTVDVYWRGKDNGPLMLLLAHLLVQNSQWRGREVRLIRVIPAEAGREEVTKHLEELIDSARITAKPFVVVSQDVKEAIRTTSKNAAKVFLGFSPPEEGKEVEFHETMERLTESLGSVVFVNSAGGMNLTS
ncbi:MAG: amino acid permease [Planctomycetaceae bacterium]